MRGAMEVLESRFKETEIGLIPKDWEVERLGDIVNFKIGRTPPRKNKDYWTNGKYYWVSISDMKNPYINNTSEMVSEKAHKEIFKEKLTPAGTLLMSFKLTIGRTVILNVDAYHNEAIISIFPKENKVLKEFLFYYLPAVDYSNLQDKVVKGNTLNTSKLNKIPIPLPPLEEQKGIADILSTVQNAIEKTEKVINATKQLKKSMMKHLFTYGAVAVDEIDRVKLKESEIGLIPEHWEVVKLGEVAEISSGGSAPQGKKYFEGNSPFIRVQHLDNDNYKVKGCDYITDEAVKKYKLKLYPKDTIIFPKSGASIYLEKRAKLPFDAYIVSHLMAVRSKSRLLLQDYLFFNLVSKKLSKDKADNYPTLNISEISQIPIPLPPLDEQQKIANILTTIDQKIQAEEKKKTVLQNLFKTLLQQLMTGKIRVKKTKT